MKANKKVILIPATDTFRKYMKTGNELLQIAAYTENVFPFEDISEVRGFYSSIIGRNRSGWNIVGIYSEGYDIPDNKNNFSQLLNLCKKGKVDLVMCKSLEGFSERIGQIREIKIPIYVLEEKRIIEN